MFQEIISQLDGVNIATKRFKRFLADFNIDIDIDITAMREAVKEIEAIGNSILIENMTKAAEASKEFSDPIFLSRLEQACSAKEIIAISWEPGGSPLVTIRMEDFAGTVDDYESAVNITRQIIGAEGGNAGIASYVWREYLYKPAREGKMIAKVGGNRRKKNDKGDIALPVNQDRTAELVQKYWFTIQTRLGNMSSLAPYWYILNYGSSSMGGWGGTPYPEISPSYFVETTQQELTLRVSEVFQNRLNFYIEEFDSEISRWVDELDAWEPGHVFGVIKDAKGWYQAYKTKTGKLGFRRAKR